MRRLNRVVKQIALTLVVTLLIPMLAPAATVSAAETETAWTVEIGENAYLEYEETDTVRTTVYYENGEALQRAEYYLDTGVILYLDLSRNTRNNTLRSIDKKRESVIRYHVNDFKTEKGYVDSRASTYGANSSGTSYVKLKSSDKLSYSYLKSYNFVDSGVTYKRALYGAATMTDPYKEDYWFFEAGTAISVISLLLGNSVHMIVQTGLVVMGILVSALSVTDWLRDYYWNYKFVQSQPNSLSFYCDDFLYRRERVYTINGDSVAEWEVVYEKSAWDIESERTNILANPANYY